MLIYQAQNGYHGGTLKWVTEVLPRASLGAHCFPWLAHCIQGPKAHFQIWKCVLFQKNYSNKIGKKSEKKGGWCSRLGTTIGTAIIPNMEMCADLNKKWQ